MNIDRFKAKLEEEQRSIVSELGVIGEPNPQVPGDWQATSGSFDAASEPEERAQKFQELDNNEGIVSPLELRLRDVRRALSNIEAGTYGTCEIGGEPIEEERLEANPAARTCIEHLPQEKDLPV